MSTKTTIKRIALVAVSALGLGLLSVIPASAALPTTTHTVDALGVTTAAPAAVATGTTVASTFSLSLSADTIATKNAAIAISLSVPTGSQVTLSDRNGAANTATPIASNSNKDAALTSTTIGTNEIANDLATVVAAGAILATADTVAGTLTIIPDVAGTYVVTLKGTTLGNPSTLNSVTATFTVVAHAAIAAGAAAGTEEATIKVTAMKVTNAVVRKGSAAATNVAVSMLAGAANKYTTFKASLISSPATSALNNSSITLAAPSTTPLVSTTSGVGVGSGTTVVSALTAGTAGGGAASISVSADATDETITAATNLSKNAISASITPDVAGVYKVLIWNDQNLDNLVSTGEKSATYQVTAGGVPTVMTLNTVNATTVTYGDANPQVNVLSANNYGSLTTLSLKDADGNLTKLASGEGIAIAPSSTTATIAVNGAGASNAGTTVNLTSSTAVNSLGLVAINVRDTVAGSSTVTFTPTGVAIATIPAQVVTVTVKDATEFPASGAVTISTLKTCSTTTAAAGASTYTATNCSSLGGSVTIKYTQTTAAASQIVPYFVKDNTGANTSYAGANYTSYFTPASGIGTYTVKYGTTAAVTDKTPANTLVTGLVSTTDALSKAFTITAADPAFSGAGGTMNVANISAVTGAKISVIATVVDQFGAPMVGQVAAFSVSGRNATTTSTNVLTDVNGNAAFSYTDAGTTGTDSISYTVGGTSANGSTSVSYSTTNAVSKVALTTHDTTAGVANDSVLAKPIVASTSTTGATGAEAGVQSISAKVTNAAGSPLVGQPVTWSVAGTGAAILSTKVTTYTDATGVATSSIYAWKSGTYTVTATAGAVSGTGTETFSQSTAAAARVISATVNGSVVTAKAEDRFGNPVASVRIYAKIASGSGYFGTGVVSTYGDTDNTGTVAFVVSGGASSVTVSNIGFDQPAGTVVGQTSAAKGYDIGGADAVAFAAAVAGSSTTAEKGVGNEYAAAGVSSATVDVAVTGSSDAIDAANEATDAANAATDAANAAAEAADAATAAAQDAQAAVAELATKVSSLIASIKSQLTSLTNLIIKIQKKVKA